MKSVKKVYKKKQRNSKGGSSMIGTVFLLTLLGTFYSGSRRGIPLQLVYSAGFFLSFLFAQKMYLSWGRKIELIVPYLSVSPETKMVFFSQKEAFDLDKPYYAAVAFLFFLLVGFLLTRLAGLLASPLRFVSIIPQFDWIVAGFLNVLIVYIWFFLCLKLLTLIPIDFIQDLFVSHQWLRNIVEKTPFFSNYIQQLWITNII
jgi:uncharacterized membrane protein required for colicin V production